MPCATVIVREMYGEEKAKALAKVPISSDTLRRRISFYVRGHSGTMHRAPP